MLDTRRRTKSDSHVTSLNALGKADYRNYHSVMTQHPENVRWQQWSLEDVAVLLSHRFPRSYIWIIKASRMHLHKFSCYDHFVQSTLFGAPEHSTDFGAFRHLHKLLTNAFQMTPSINLRNGVHTVHKATNGHVLESHSAPAANGFFANGDKCSKDGSFVFNPPHHSDCVSFTLIGFSKGCVVLNQLLYELQGTKSDETLAAFIKNIKTIYWLDGGHPGGGNTWVTDADVLKEFAWTGIAVHTHVTPYQVRDSMRSWIGKEHSKFVQTLRELGVQVDNQIHFESETPTLENHFRILEVF
ncbi:UPF0565 protein C2orf69 homolog isoform X2 [Protopterus annectens]|uniref:UPF0565 protein C2orf69 homolog isoform X2 n=1 Tax=Protopterus annectens TaxID=7888 RepID=UPI001CFA4D23|nr:UPF0565 protein C2orf69 homolog isoform X2 [Protopterus annectens]